MKILAILVRGVSAVFLAFTALKRPPKKPANGQAGRVRHVVDGDSLYIEGVEPQIRLWGVDAPETDEPGYDAATQMLTRLAYGKDVRCEQVEIDKYGRIVGRCFLGDGREINRMMIESGAAKEYLRFTDGYYSA